MQVSSAGNRQQQEHTATGIVPCRSVAAAVGYRSTPFVVEWEASSMARRRVVCSCDLSCLCLAVPSHLLVTPHDETQHGHPWCVPLKVLTFCT